MVDLTPFKVGIENAKKQVIANSDDPRESFRIELLNAGLKITGAIQLNVLVRLADSVDKAGKQSGWYIYSEHDNQDSVLGVGVYGSWHETPPKTVWTSKSLNSMSTAERLKYHEQLERSAKLREAEQIQLQEAAAKKCLYIWEKANDATNNAYLQRKQVKAFDYIKESGGNLIVPITFNDTITSLQFIEPEGAKHFKKHGKIKGCYYKITGKPELIYIAEGYSTGASIAMATGATVYIAFNAGNIYEVTSKIKTEYPNSKIVIAGDDDSKNQVNTGKLKATQAGEALQCEVMFPPVGYKDFNDLHVDKGLDKLAAYLQVKPIAEAKPNSAISPSKTHYDYIQPTGILAELVNYYNATAGNYQPLFAIQAALAIGSLICARNFETNFSNRTSLYFLNVGLSATGKEHGKKVIEKILNSTGSGHLIAPDGYNSGSAVFSALMDRPRHISSVDEFSKYLEAAQSKNSSHLMEANTSLMEAIGRLDGVMRPRAYAASLLTKEKRKELSEMKIVNPAITFVAMTTPDDLFRTISMRSVKDGFLNRFIICLSDAKRELREHKEPLEVPDSIASWITAINRRRNDASEIATEQPHVNAIPFSLDALALQKDFQLYCIEKANQLEQFQIAEIVGRSSEMAMRISLISALSNDPHCSVISKQDMEFAISWIKFNLERLVDKLKLSVSGSEHEGQKKEILQAIRERKKGVTWVDMQKRPPFSKYKIKDLREILQSLCDSDLIIEDAFVSGRGRPTKIYYAQD